MFNSRMHPAVTITASYAFFPLPEPQRIVLQKEMREFGHAHTMKGLVLLAPEGVNATVCGSSDAIDKWKEMLRALHPGIEFKDSHAEQCVFRRWLVKIKPELITLKQPGIAPEGKRNHLSPQEWKQMLERDDVVVVDTRNTYETAIGAFRNAVTPAIRRFQDFPRAIAHAGIPTNKKVLLYCTGGIRCEKAVFAMEQQGYENVYQLDGGILAYLKQYPEDAFEGECFVFDHRVAVDQHLRPSATYQLCTACGDPATAALCTQCSMATAA